MRTNLKEPEKFHIISPLGKRDGLGTFETFFDVKKYRSPREAADANDVAIVNFIQDSNGIVYFQIYYSRDPDDKVYYKLLIQHFPFGVDVIDDHFAEKLAVDLLAEKTLKT